MEIIDSIVQLIRAAHFRANLPHEWRVSRDQLRRRCAVCDRVEECEDGSGMGSPLWLDVQKGDYRRHIKK